MSRLPNLPSRPAPNRAGRGSSPSATRGEWVSYHIFYQGSRDQVLSQLVFPVVCDLWRCRWIRGFFFIRYGLGGPHIRWRLLCAPEHKEEIDGTVRREAAGFFARWPSDTRLSDDEIRRQNRGFATNDPACPMDTVYPNNSMAELPFEPELERYGGPARLQDSLNFFCVSSAHVLQLAAQAEPASRSRQLFRAMRALLRQALGFATDADDLAHLLAPGLMENRYDHSLLKARADKEFERCRDDYLRLVRKEITQSRDPRARRRLAEHLVTGAAGALQARVRDAGDPARWRIVTSQLHMTANRMGISIPEEGYIGHILWRALNDAAQESWALPPVESRPVRSGSWLAVLARTSLDQLAMKEAQK